jgi:hypothetical protein
MVSLIVGWIFLIASWTVPYLIKDKQTRKFVGLVLSALATGIFLGYMISNIRF